MIISVQYVQSVRRSLLTLRGPSVSRVNEQPRGIIKGPSVERITDKIADHRSNG